MNDEPSPCHGHHLFALLLLSACARGPRSDVVAMTDSLSGTQNRDDDKADIIAAKREATMIISIIIILVILNMYCNSMKLLLYYCIVDEDLRYILHHSRQV
jgi:hypothetical protein